MDAVNQSAVGGSTVFTYTSGSPFVHNLQEDEFGTMLTDSLDMQDLLEDIQGIPVSEETKLDIPELPSGILLPEGLGKGAGAWLDDYIDYAIAISPMTPRYFHESAGLWLTSVAIARRLTFNVGFGFLYPNLYILWDAQSTLYRKSTAMDTVWLIASQVFPFLLAQTDSTPEALVSDLAGKEPTNFKDMSDAEKSAWEKERDYAAQRGLIIDEMSGMLAGMGRDYNAGMQETIMKLYDCKTSITRSTRGQGRIQVHNSYLSILGASTPAALAPYIRNINLWTNGFFARIAILTVEDKPKWVEAKYIVCPPPIIQRLQDLFESLPASKFGSLPQAVAVQFGRGVKAAWDKYNKALSFTFQDDSLDPKLQVAYGRLPAHVMKVATILAALDWKNSSTPIVEMPHLARAMQIVESWRESVHRAIIHTEPSGVEQLWTRIKKTINTKNNGTGVTFRDIRNNIRDVKDKEIQEYLNGMMNSGDIVRVSRPSGTKGGRPSVIYKVA